MTDKEKEQFEKYGGKPYGEIKCPFFTKKADIPSELNRDTLCSKCWAKYDYHCYANRYFDCDQYNEMIKTLKPEYLKSIIDAMRTEVDLDIISGCECGCKLPKNHCPVYDTCTHYSISDKSVCNNPKGEHQECISFPSDYVFPVDELDEPRSIGQITLNKAYITVLTYDAGLECSFIIDGNCSCDIGIKINDESEES